MHAARLRPASSASVWLALIKLGPFFILATLIALFSISAEPFTQWSNLRNVMFQTTPIVLLAVGQLFVVLTRGIDISMGANVGLSSVLGALFATHVTDNALLVILTMLAAGSAVGLINALVISRINNPFMVTLAMLSAVHGLAILISGQGGQSVGGIPTFIQELATGTTFGLPTPFLLALLIVAAAGAFLNFTRFGRWIYAIGGNPSAATRVGIPSGVVLISCYTFAGLSAGLAALIISGRFSSGFPEAGTTMELDAIAAVVIGGASFFGGRGGVSAALVGALILGVMRNGLNVSGVAPDWQLVAIGVILIGALGLDQLRMRVEERTRAAKGRQAEQSDARGADPVPAGAEAS